jgi:hypothetical protein
MRKPKMTEYGDYATWLNFPVMSNYAVRLIFTDDLDKSAAGRRLSSRPSVKADAFCFHVKDEGQSYIVLKHDSNEGTIAHECWHIVHRVLGYCGVADMDDEIVAYHISYMVEKVYEFKKRVQAVHAVKSSNKKRGQR